MLALYHQFGAFSKQLPDDLRESKPMTLTLADVAAHPTHFAYPLELPPADRLLLRPLEASDVDALAAFLQALSPPTRRFATFPGYDKETAQELCDAINRYDKLRFVVEEVALAKIVALFEFSLDLPPYDVQRYASYGAALDAARTCRFGPTIADSYQNRGLGSKSFPYLVDIARRLGKTRMILWGGVYTDNQRAIRFYEKQGFRTSGSFVYEHGPLRLDMFLDLAVDSG